MFVIDGALWIKNHDVRLSATAGIASGDDNPNEDTLDRNYKGFIGLQEIYSGKRVRSAFLMSGAGKIKRPLSMPTSAQSARRFSSIVSGFTNLIFAGTGVLWEPSDSTGKFSFNPNILVYWQDSPTRKFDAVNMVDLPSPAASFLGTEINLFVSYNFLKALKGFFVGSVFAPGQHYEDIAGKPLNAEQLRRLERVDKTGFSKDLLPNIGDDVAVALNFGLEYKF
jgi:hypothetical protein